jgi:hypothetical protein
MSCHGVRVVVLPPDLMDLTRRQIETGTFTPDQVNALFEVFYQPAIFAYPSVIGPDENSEDNLVAIQVHAVVGNDILEGFIVLETNTNSLSFHRKTGFWDTFKYK